MLLKAPAHVQVVKWGQAEEVQTVIRWISNLATDQGDTVGWIRMHDVAAKRSKPRGFATAVLIGHVTLCATVTAWLVMYRYQFCNCSGRPYNSSDDAFGCFGCVKLLFKPHTKLETTNDCTEAACSP